MILVDTSVLVYAVGSEHPLRNPCRAVIAAIGTGRLAATTTVEVLQEFAHVRARRRGREDAAEVTARYARLLAPLITLDADDLTAGLAHFRSLPQIGAFDAVLAAVAQRRAHVHALLSADRAFAAVPQLTYLDPAHPDVAERLGIAN